MHFLGVQNWVFSTGFTDSWCDFLAFSEEVINQVGGAAKCGGVRLVW